VLHVDFLLKESELTTKFSSDLIAENRNKVGWKPTWNKERLLQNIDVEVQAVIDLGQAKSSLIDSIRAAAAAAGA
jgi:hypothetical protein